MLNLNKVSKTYSTGFIPKKVVALNSLTLQIQPGQVYAFLGPNGAGKTTTIKLILGMIFPDQGSIHIDGIDYLNKQSRRKIGYLPDQPYFYEDLTAVEYLKFSGKMYGLSRQEISSRTEELLSLIGLKGKEAVRIRSFSRGMLQRLGMAQALIHNPDLLILDEPLTGLDPSGRRDFRDLILSLKQQGKTIFFSSHILADAEMISDRVGILNQGRLVREMKLFEMQTVKMQGMEVAFQWSGTQKIVSENLSWPVELYDHRGTIYLQDEKSAFDAVRWVEESGCTIISVSPKRKTLEEIYLEEMQN